MTAPAINGTKFPQPVDELLPAARKLTKKLGEVPSRNRLMTEYRIGAPKATELRTRLIEEKAREIVTRDSTEPASTWTLANDVEVLRTAADLADERGEIPTAAELATLFRIAPERADLLNALVGVALDRRAKGLPVDTDRPNVEPTRDPWDYAEPIGPNPLPAPAVPESVPLVAPEPTPAPEITPAEPVAEVTPVSHPDTPAPPAPVRSAVVWPVVLLALPAFVAIWSGWVGLGGLTGFGIVHPLPGIWDSFSINSAITLPIGVETYGAYALYVWLSGRVPERARRFAKWSALGSLAIGALGQVAYHLLEAAGVTSAPWWITTAVACLPVAVLGMGAALAHLVRTHD
ncbi:ABC transporter permease [Micromonospora chokoriensis]